MARFSTQSRDAKTRVLGFFSIILFALVACVHESPDPRALGPGDRAPIFSVTLDDGGTFSTADLGGDPALIAFFNTGCADCRREFPELQTLYDQVRAEGLPARIVCISRAQDAESVAAYWQQENLSLPYSAQPDDRVYRLFAASIIPRIYILAPDRTITAAWTDNPLPTAQTLLQSLTGR